MQQQQQQRLLSALGSQSNFTANTAPAYEKGNVQTEDQQPLPNSILRPVSSNSQHSNRYQATQAAAAAGVNNRLAAFGSIQTTGE